MNTWYLLCFLSALAVAASIPSDIASVNGIDIHNLLLLITYVIVIFSIIVQGLTIAPMIRTSIEAAKQYSQGTAQ